MSGPRTVRRCHVSSAGDGGRAFPGDSGGEWGCSGRGVSDRVLLGGRMLSRGSGAVRGGRMCFGRGVGNRVLFGSPGGVLSGGSGAVRAGRKYAGRGGSDRGSGE